MMQLPFWFAAQNFVCVYIYIVNLLPSQKDQKRKEKKKIDRVVQGEVEGHEQETLGM